MPLSYNEAKNRRLELRHIFIPSKYGAISEAIIGFLALIIFNIGTLNQQLLLRNFNDVDALPLWRQIIRDTLNSFHSHPQIEQIMLFALWAILGAVLYIVLFRVFQAFFGVKRSVGLGVGFVRKDHARGIVSWLASLHDFFLAAIIVILGGAAVLMGALVCFGYASEELRSGLSVGFPDNIRPLLLSGVLVVLSVRLVALGISLLSRRFRRWYTA